MPSIKYNCICWNYLDLPKRTANTVYFCKQVSAWYCDQNKVGNWSGSWLAESSYWLLWWQSTWGTFKLTPVPNVLLRFLGWTTCFPETVCNRVWDTFSLVWWVCKKCDEYVNINRAVLKRQLAQRIQVKSFNVSAAARYTQHLKILEDMFVVRVL